MVEELFWNGDLKKGIGVREGRIYIIIVNYNGRGLLDDCLQAIFSMSYKNYEVVLVDNGSSDDSVVFVQNRFPSVYIIKSEINLGYAKGNNIGMEYALYCGAEYVLLLNNDVVVLRETVSDLINVIEKESSIAAVGGKNYYYGKYPEIWQGGLIFDWAKGTVIDVEKQNTGDKCHMVEVDYVPGSCILMRGDAIQKVGTLDEEWFAYGEESDWCLRAKRKGYRIVYSRSACLVHKVGQTSTVAGRLYFEHRNGPRFMVRHMPKKYLKVYFWRYYWNFLQEVIHYGRRREWLEVYACFAGVWDWCRNNYGIGRGSYFINKGLAKQRLKSVK